MGAISSTPCDCLTYAWAKLALVASVSWVVLQFEWTALLMEGQKPQLLALTAAYITGSGAVCFYC